MFVHQRQITSCRKTASLSFDRGTVLLKEVVRKDLPDVLGSGVWKWDGRVGAWRCDAIHYPALRKVLTSRFGARFTDEVMKPVHVSWFKIDLPKLRTEHAEALQGIRTGKGITARGNSQDPMHRN
ncbi:MAG: hypothetical protein ACYTEL_25470 [Planctomycetota bacterium]